MTTYYFRKIPIGFSRKRSTKEATMPITEFAINGVGVLVEWPERLARPLRRATSGTSIRQNEGSGNWFHFAPATPINGFFPDRNYQLWLDFIKLRASLDNARIERVHLRNGQRLVWSLEDATRLPIASASVRETFPADDQRFMRVIDEHDVHNLAGFRGFALSVYVSFLGNPGEVVFESAHFGYFYR